MEIPGVETFASRVRQDVILSQRPGLTGREVVTSSQENRRLVNGIKGHGCRQGNKHR